MTTRREIEIGIYEISELEIAWLAGLLEGEGCFIVQNYRYDGYEAAYASVVLTMTDEDVVKRAAGIMGVGVTSFHPPSSKNTGRLRQYRCKVTGYRAVLLFKRLLPYMGERRRQKILDLIEVNP